MTKKFRDIKTHKELVETFAELGWMKEVEYDKVDMIKGQVVVKRISIRAEDLTCRHHGYSGMFVQLRPTGIITHCYECAQTSGPLSESAQRVLSVRRVSLREGWELMDANNQQPPAGMVERPRQRRRAIRELR